MSRKRVKNKKNKTIQIRLSDSEYNLYKFRIKEFHKYTSIKINTSKLIRIVLSNADNVQFLHSVGYLSYFDFMDSVLFNSSKDKYKRLKKYKR